MSVPQEVKRLDRIILWRKNWGAEGKFSCRIIYPHRIVPRGGR
ncbi:hypothetical protein ES705_30344 [subsurface metagenome]